MKKLPKPVVQEFCSTSKLCGHSVTVLENQSGDIFLGINEDPTPEEFHLYRWRQDGQWDLIFTSPGFLCYEGRNGGAATTHLHFDDPQRQCLIFLLRNEDRTFFLLAVSYEGHELSRTPVISAPWYDRFTNGDYLVSTFQDDQRLVLRISTAGETLWEYTSVNESVPIGLIPVQAKALSDGTALLWDMLWRNDRAQCRLYRLNVNGAPCKDPELSALDWDSFPLPEVKKANGGWAIEDCTPDYSDDGPPSLAMPHRFRRILFDTDWQIQERQEASMRFPGAGLGNWTFYPDGVLIGFQGLHPRSEKPYKMDFYFVAAFLPFSSGSPQPVLSTKEFPLQLGFPSYYIPLFRREDGSFLFSVDYPNANAKAVLLAADPSGNILWLKKYRCEGKRWVFPKGDKLITVWADMIAPSVTAETYRLPPLEQTETCSSKHPQ